MSDIQTCLSVFAVASWTDNPQSINQIRKAIEEYVVRHPPENELAVLIALQEAFRNMKMASTVASKIQAEILNRIALLSAVSHWTNVKDQSANV